MNSYQLKQTARSRRNNAQKVQRPLLNFKASKNKAKDRRKSSSNDQNQEDIYRGDDAGDNEVISDHASGDDNDDMDDISSDSQGSNRSSQNSLHSFTIFFDLSCKAVRSFLHRSLATVFLTFCSVIRYSSNASRHSSEMIINNISGMYLKKLKSFE